MNKELPMFIRIQGKERFGKSQFCLKIGEMIIKMKGGIIKNENGKSRD